MNEDKLLKIEQMILEYAQEENISFDESLHELAALDVLTKYNLSSRAYHALRGIDVLTVRDLLSCNINNLKTAPNCGAGTIDEILNLLKNMGYIPVNKLCYGNIPLLFHRKGSGIFISTEKLAVNQPTRLRPTSVYLTKTFYQLSPQSTDLFKLSLQLWMNNKALNQELKD